MSSSNRGRKPIQYKKEDLERQPMIMLVCGETGVGKTYRNKLEIKHYMMDHLAVGKKGRKVLAFDTNDDDYSCTFSVTVNDTEKPMITCPADVSVSADGGACEATNVAIGSANNNLPGSIEILNAVPGIALIQNKRFVPTPKNRFTPKK